MMPGKMYQCRSWKLLIIATSNWSDTDMIFEHVVGFRPGAIRSANERPLSWLRHWLSHNNWKQLLNQVVLRWQIFVGKWHKSCYMSRIYGERQPGILVKVMYLYRSHMQKKRWIDCLSYISKPLFGDVQLNSRDRSDIPRWQTFVDDLYIRRYWNSEFYKYRRARHFTLNWVSQFLSHFSCFIISSNQFKRIHIYTHIHTYIIHMAQSSLSSSRFSSLWLQRWL